MSTKPSPVDPSFPQLEVARDPEMMREVFQRHLWPLREEAYHVRECQVSHTRYRRAIHCMLQYTLRLVEPGTGRERSQWVTGAMYAGGRTRRIWEKLRRSDQGGGVLSTSLTPAPFRWILEKLRVSDPRQEILDPSLAFAPFFYIPALDMLVQVFPHDRRLPSLPLLIAGSPPELEPLLLAQFGPGVWQSETWKVEPVRYLAERRATLRLTMQARDATTGRAEERRFYAKVYHDEEQGEQTYKVLRALWDKASAGGEGFTVGRPLAYLSGLRTLIQEEVSGSSLQDMLRRGDEVTPAVRKVARGLAALHLGYVVPLRRRPLQREVTILERTCELLQGAYPHLRSEIKETVDTVVAGLKEVPPAPTHCDLSPGHIMFTRDRIALLDLDEFAGADPILDVAHVLASLANVPVFHPVQERNHAQTVARAFVEEYFNHVPEAWRARLPFHYAGATLKIAGALSRNRATGWSDRSKALIKEAKDSLASRVW